MQKTEQIYKIDGKKFIKDIINTFCSNYGSEIVSLDAIYEILCGDYGLLVANKKNKINTTIIVKNSDCLFGAQHKLLEDVNDRANEYYEGPYNEYTQTYKWLTIKLN